MIEMSKKMKWICGAGVVILIIAIVSTCSSGSSSKSSEEKETAQKEEFKTLPASSLILKGKHAKLFKLADDTYKVSLVQSNNGWQVRVKMTIANKSTYSQFKDKKIYSSELGSVYGKLLNSSDVEIESLDMDEGDWNTLFEEEVDAEAEVKGTTYSYHNYNYETAKSMFDKTVAVELSGIELEKAKKENTSSKLLDDDTQETLDDVKDIIKTEKELLDALGGLF